MLDFGCDILSAIDHANHQLSLNRVLRTTAKNLTLIESDNLLNRGKVISIDRELKIAWRDGDGRTLGVVAEAERLGPKFIGCAGEGA